MSVSSLIQHEWSMCSQLQKKIKIKRKSSVHGCVWKLLWKEVSLHYVFVHGTCGFSLVHNLWDHRIFLCTNGNYVLNETMSRTLAIHYRVHLPCNQQILSIVHTSKLTLWYSGFWRLDKEKKREITWISFPSMETDGRNRLCIAARDQKLCFIRSECHWGRVEGFVLMEFIY